ncbi:unnamed protein product [Notodromas monacha]|uniref:C2H2-type domain-containing protein n=1 Tax=Notodromas monacha TaxID=399045 RepID=A0A7R9BF30_9CRUS|nr:unnamed protein product [Notodromas monacha]CAG0914217.1 unnamed protein product [Notodromas monacha]
MELKPPERRCDLPPQVCGLCAQVFFSPYDFSIHLKSHNVPGLSIPGASSNLSTSGPVFPSTAGPIKRRVSKDRGSHSKSDGGGYCELCKKFFSRKDHVRRHLVTVHKLGAEFAENDSLVRIGEPPPPAPPPPKKKEKVEVVRSHERGDPWCRICSKFFSRKDHLKRHLKNVHGVSAEEADQLCLPFNPLAAQASPQGSC